VRAYILIMLLHVFNAWLYAGLTSNFRGDSVRFAAGL